MIRITAPPSIDNAAVGGRLSVIRAITRKNQKDFAADAGLAQNRYNQYERGKKQLSPEAALAIKIAYGVTLDYLYDGDMSGLRRRTIDAINALENHDRGD